MSTTSSDSAATDSVKPGHRQWRAAVLGLLALVAVIVLASLFSGGDAKKGAAGESSASADEASSSASASNSENPAPSSSVSQVPTSADAPPTSQAPTTEPAPQLSGVTVLITSQSWNAQTRSIEVVGSVQGIATETSKCLAVATGPEALKAGVDGVFDGQGTSCGLISIPVPQGASGAYQVNIEFSTSGGVSKSAPVTVQVP